MLRNLCVQGLKYPADAGARLVAFFHPKEGSRAQSLLQQLRCFRLEVCVCVYVCLDRPV